MSRREARVLSKDLRQTPFPVDWGAVLMKRAAACIVTPRGSQ